MRGPRAEDELITERLRLRRWRREDDPEITAISAHVEVRRYLNHWQGPYVDRFETHWREQGFGLYCVERLELPGCIGFVGVARPFFIPAIAHRIEIGWRLAHETWGHGYATEAAAAVRDHANDRLGVSNLISIIHPQNTRSQRVAAKLGMNLDHHVHSPNLGIAVGIWTQRPERSVP